MAYQKDFVYQLPFYGAEVNDAIHRALIEIPEELAKKAYIDQVLVKDQVIPYVPTMPYHPSTKKYVDDKDSSTNKKIDDEIARATAAEKLLNEKHVLTSNNNGYKYINLSTLDNSKDSLIAETALEEKLAELSLSFFVFYQINATTGALIEVKNGNSGVNPYSIADTSAQLPTSNVPVDALGLVLKDDTSIDVYKYDGTSWSVLSTPTIQNGWLFAEESTGHGFYWFQNTWNKVDMNVDMSEYYKKTEVDSLLTNYVEKVTLGDPADLTTSVKTTIVGAINSLKTLTDTKDTLPTINSGSVLANTDTTAGKPTTGMRFTTSATVATIAQRTSTGTLKAVQATDDDDLTTLKQVNDLVATDYQPKIVAGTANDIVAYSGIAGTFNTLTRVTSISATPTDTEILTAKATKDYVNTYAPIIVSQGNSSTPVTTNQLTFWIES